MLNQTANKKKLLPLGKGLGLVPVLLGAKAGADAVFDGSSALPENALQRPLDGLDEGAEIVWRNTNARTDTGPGLIQAVNPINSPVAVRPVSPVVEIAAIGVGALSLLAYFINSRSGAAVGVTKATTEDTEVTEASSIPSGSSPSAVTFSGTAIKGPLAQAQVFVDENGNLALDAGEPNVRTDIGGRYSLTSSAATPKLVVMLDASTIDMGSGTVLSGLKMLAPADSKVITPLTTLLESSGLTMAEVRAALGLPDSIDILIFNPFDTASDPDDALAVEKVAVQVAAIVSAHAKGAEGAGATQAESLDAAVSALTAVLQTKDQAGTTLGLSDGTDLTAIETAMNANAAALPGINAAAASEIAAEVSTALGLVNTKVQGLTNTDLSDPTNANTFGLIQVLGDQALNAASDKVAGVSGAGVDLTDSNAVDAAALNAAPTAISLSTSTLAEDASSLLVGNLTTTDDATDDPNFAYALGEISGTSDQMAFTINNADGALFFVSQPDFETQSSYRITVIATDQGGKSFSESFTIAITDSANESLPVFISGQSVSFAENATSIVYTAFATDSDGDAVSYTLGTSKDEASFSIDANTGALTFSAPPDYETPADSFATAEFAASDNVYSVDVIASDAQGGSRTQTLSVSVTDVVEPGPFGVRIQGQEGNHFTGYAVSDAGDVNNDGYDDVLISAYKENGLTGASYLIWGDELENEQTGLGGDELVNLASLGSQGIRITGAAGGDSAGRSLSSAGDVDGDGKADILIGADGADTGGSMSGETYLLFGDALDDGTTSFGLGSIDGTNGVKITGGGSNNYAGWSVSSAGDVDNDGKDDLIIGAYGVGLSFGPTTFPGEAYLVFGDALDDGASTLSLSNLNGTNGVALTGDAQNDYRGYSVSQAGDVDGDGKSDLLVGAYQANSKVGETYLVFGDALDNGTASLNLNSLDGTNGVAIVGLSAGDQSGFSVSAAGDVDQDGKDDVLIGAPRADDINGSYGGESYLIFGDALDDLNATFNVSSLDGSNGAVIAGKAGSYYSGTSVSGAGDIDADGKADILIGAYGANEAYLIYGDTLDDGLSSVQLAGLSATDGVTISGISSSDQLGFSVSGAGDVDGDGVDDLLLGAPVAVVGSTTYSGEGYLVTGALINDVAAGVNVASAGTLDFSTDLGWI